MPRLIDADALIEHIEVHCGGCGEARHCVNTAPTIAPVKHGGCEKCRDTTPLPDVGDSHDYYIRDGAMFHYDAQFGYEGTGISYCPSCGAKMDGDAHE